MRKIAGGNDFLPSFLDLGDRIWVGERERERTYMTDTLRLSLSVSLSLCVYEYAYDKFTVPVPDMHRRPTVDCG